MCSAGLSRCEKISQALIDKEFVITRVHRSDFSVLCIPKVSHVLASSDKTSFKIIKYGWVVLILWPLLETYSFTNFD